MKAEEFLKAYKATDYDPTDNYTLRATATKGNYKSGCPFYKGQLLHGGTGYTECSEASRLAEASGAQPGETMLVGTIWYKLCSWQPCTCTLFIQAIKREYPSGTKIKLRHMEGEPRMETGLTGIVDHVDDIGQIHVNWENGSSLALTAYLDRFTRI